MTTKNTDNCYDFVEALKTEAGRKHAMYLQKAYLSMLTNEERLAVFRNFCTTCGSLNSGCVHCGACNQCHA